MRLSLYYALIACTFVLLLTACANQSTSNEGNTSVSSQSNEITPFKNLTVKKLQQFQKENKAFTLLDVRTENEIAKGKIPSAQSIDFYSDNFKNEINKLDRDTPYVVYCASGKRSAKACQIMQVLQFKEVYNLTGGYRAFAASPNP